MRRGSLRSAIVVIGVFFWPALHCAAQSAKSPDEIKGEEFLQEYPSKWEFTQETDSMTETKVYKALSFQAAETANISAQITAVCKTKDEMNPAVTGDYSPIPVNYKILITDKDGKPTVSVVMFQRWADVRIRVNDKVGDETLCVGSFSNEFILNPDGPRDMLIRFDPSAGPNYGKRAFVWGERVEFKTDRGPLVVNIPSSDPTLQKLYAACQQQ